MKFSISTVVFSLFMTLLIAQDIPKEATDISPLLIGEQIPNIMLKDTDGKSVSLTELVAQKQTVLIFYRGGWCPYCNVHLGELQTIETDVLKGGYQIIAISPDAPQKLSTSADKHKLNYKLLSDADTNAAQQFGLAFQAPEKYKEMLGNYSDKNNTGVLPVPAVFVLNKQGEILFEFISPNYKKRLSASLLLAVINNLAE
jgi:peroxiredoxin